MEIAVSVKELLEAGVHFGHQTKRWNPKMRPFIFEERNGIYIIDLAQSVEQLDKACAFAKQIASRGGRFLFVGTKKQAQESIYEATKACDSFYVNERWLGGTLTNNQTIRKSVNRLLDLERMETEGTMQKLSKKEASSLRREKAKLEKHLQGIKGMEKLPACLFIVDTKREHIAVAEARKLNIPIIAILDTNADPDEVDYIIAGNDDAIKSIKLIACKLAEAINAGRQSFVVEQQEAQQEEAPSEKKEKDSKPAQTVAAPKKEESKKVKKASPVVENKTAEKKATEKKRAEKKEKTTKPAVKKEG